MNTDWSVNALLAHCDALIKADPDHSSKYRSWKTACRSVISMQPPEVQNDIRKVDPKSAVMIYAGEHNPKPKTAKEYQGRISAAIQSFTESLDEPGSGSPSEEPPAKGIPLAQVMDKFVGRTSAKVNPQTASNTLTIPIRSDFLAQLILPYDITPAEARRLSRIIEALPIEQEEETVQ